MDERALLLLTKAREDTLKLAELLLLVLEGLVAGLAEVVKSADHLLEFGSARIDILKHSWVKVFLVFELGDLVLEIVLDASIVVPILTGQLLEKSEAELTAAGHGVFRPLGHIERHGEHLLLVRGIEAELLNSSFVGNKGIVEVRLDHLVGAEAWDSFRGHFVDEPLELDGVSADLSELRRVTESNVFETVNLSKLPEEVVDILALALDAENFGQISLCRDALHHVVEKLGLGQGVFVIHGEVIEKLFFGSVTSLGLKGTEAGDEVVSTIVGLVGDTFLSMCYFLEDAGGQLKAKEVGS